MRPNVSEIAFLRLFPYQALIIRKKEKNMIISLLEKLFGEERQIAKQSSLNQTTPQDNKEIIIIPLQYRDDIENLKTYVGEENWKAGLEISLYLSELLPICPRERRRSDSYRKLIDYLDEELNIKLIIKRKEKR